MHPALVVQLFAFPVMSVIWSWVFRVLEPRAQPGGFWGIVPISSLPIVMAFSTSYLSSALLASGFLTGLMSIGLIAALVTGILILTVHYRLPLRRSAKLSLWIPFVWAFGFQVSYVVIAMLYGLFFWNPAILAASVIGSLWIGLLLRQNEIYRLRAMQRIMSWLG